MALRRILDSALLEVIISRLCHELIEHYGTFDNTIMIGLQPRGVFLADRLRDRLAAITGKQLPLGRLDITFYRDDFRRREKPLRPNKTDIPLQIEGMNVILVDDVLFTGRTVRAAMDALLAFGRPEKVELLILINRIYGRDLPIEPNYVGKEVQTLAQELVRVEWREQGHTEDHIAIINREEGNYE